MFINSPDAVPFPIQDGRGIIETIGMPIMHAEKVYFEYGSYCGDGCGRGGTIVMKRGKSGEWLVAEVLSKWLS